MQGSVKEIVDGLSKPEIKILRTIHKSGEEGAADADLRSKHRRAIDDTISGLCGKGLIKRKLLEKDIQKAEESGPLPVSDGQKLLSYPHKVKGQKRTPVPTGNYVLTPLGEKVSAAINDEKQTKRKKILGTQIWIIVSGVLIAVIAGYLIWKFGWLD